MQERAARLQGSNMRLFWGTPPEIHAQRAAALSLDKQAAKAALPKGMGGGKIAAIVAGVALAGGTLYMMTRKKDKPPETVGPWTDRVASERTGSEAGTSFNR